MRTGLARARPRARRRVGGPAPGLHPEGFRRCQCARQRGPGAGGTAHAPLLRRLRAAFAPFHLQVRESLTCNNR